MREDNIGIILDPMLWHTMHDFSSGCVLLVAASDYFNEAAMKVLEIEDADGVMHTYGLPETQSFEMMFVREDILAQLDIEIPKTWDDVKDAIPDLQANNLQIGYTIDYKIFLYQMGGDRFADDGLR